MIVGDFRNAYRINVFMRYLRKKFTVLVKVAKTLREIPQLFI